MARTETRDDTTFIPLPYHLRRDILGGCQCPHCAARPGSTPQWDTLAFVTKNPAQAWSVHYPELRD